LPAVHRVEQGGAALLLFDIDARPQQVGNAGEAFRKLQKQLLEQAKARIEDTPFEDRDHASVTLAISRRHLPELQTYLQKFRKQFSKFAQPKEEAPDEVYTLTMAFFPCTQLKKKKGVPQ
jgi:uncharacterized protein (TIGR02147 family)